MQEGLPTHHDYVTIYFPATACARPACFANIPSYRLEEGARGGSSKKLCLPPPLAKSPVFSLKKAVPANMSVHCLLLRRPGVRLGAWEGNRRVQGQTAEQEVPAARDCARHCLSQKNPGISLKFLNEAGGQWEQARSGWRGQQNKCASCWGEEVGSFPFSLFKEAQA